MKELFEEMTERFKPNNYGKDINNFPSFEDQVIEKLDIIIQLLEDSRMPIKVGGYYENRHGQRVKIVSKNDDGRYTSSSGGLYNKYGRGVYSPDLVRELI